MGELPEVITAFKLAAMGSAAGGLQLEGDQL